MRLIDNAIVGTAIEFHRVATEASGDENGNPTDMTAAIVIVGSEWGIALTDNRIREIKGNEEFERQIQRDIGVLRKALLASSRPKIILRNPRGEE
jgi:hypothetical protein